MVKMIVYKYDEDAGGYGAGLIFAEITNKTFGNNQTPEQFWDESSNYIKLGIFDLPIKFLKAIGYKKGCMEINLTYVE